MKKIYIAMAVLAAAALTSCVREQSFNDVKLEENDVVFAFQAGTSTRSAESLDSPVKSGAVLDLGEADGSYLVLEETIEDLNSSSPATKGTPAYTENVGLLYANNMGVYASGFGDATFVNMDEERVGGGWRYRHNYNGNKWPANENTQVDFYFRMPADMNQHGVTLGASAYSNGSITFNYDSPETADAQRDILFAGRKLSHKEHNDFLPNGAPVLFHHALTGVKFRIGNPDSEISGKNIRITGITLKGLTTTGTCTVYPRKEAQADTEDEEGNTVSHDPDYIDNRESDYSSGDGTLTTGTVRWTPGDYTKDLSLSQESGLPIADYSQGDYPFAPSFATASDHNLNDDNASYTFWVIPQEVGNTNEVLEKKDSLIITYNINNQIGKEARIALYNATWKAGELRTFTLKIKDVGITITDELTEGEKTNVSLTNTGNTTEWVRAQIVANWADDTNTTFVGFEKNSVWNETTGMYEAPENDTFVTPWTLLLNSNHTYNIADKSFTAGGKYANQAGVGGQYGRYGAFDDLPGDNWDWWTMNDGYIYYTQPVGAGATGSAATTPLFTKFKMAPVERIAYELKDPMTGEREAVNIHLIMDILVQAIEVKEGQSWQDAWNATKE